MTVDPLIIGGVVMFMASTTAVVWALHRKDSPATKPAAATPLLDPASLDAGLKTAEASLVEALKAVAGARKAIAEQAEKARLDAILAGVGNREAS